MLLSLPLIAVLMILPFLAARHIARLGGFGTGASGQAWTAWAELGLGLSLLLFTLAPLVVALVHLVRTMMLLGELRRAVRGGAPATAPPHPEQWEEAGEWGGGSLVVAGLLAGIVLAFPGVLNDPVRTWVQTWPIAQDGRMVGIPVAAIGLASIVQRYRKRALAEIERRWPSSAREAPEAAAKEWSSQPVLDSDGDPADPTHVQRRPLDRVGGTINTAAIALTGIAVLAAVITFIAAGAVLDDGAAPGSGQRFLLTSSMLLLTGAVVLYVLGAVLQNIAQTGEQRELFTAALNPAAPPPGIGSLARHWSIVNPLWSNFLGLLGALVLLLALPARFVATAVAQTWGTIGLVAAVLMLVLAAVLHVAAEQRTREPRNLVLQRWPILKPNDMTTWYEEMVTQGLAGDGQSYAAMADAAVEQPGPQGAEPAAQTPPVSPSPSTSPSPSPSASPSRSTSPSRRSWGLPKKVRRRGLGNLYR